MIDRIGDIRFRIANKMRYDTLGDWYDDGLIEVYAGMDPIEQIAVGIHELVERTLLHLQNVTEKQVNEWDGITYDLKMYDKDTRYKKAHLFAEKVEKEIIKTAGRTWKDYGKHVDNLEVNY